MVFTIGAQMPPPLTFSPGFPLAKQSESQAWMVAGEPGEIADGWLPMAQSPLATPRTPQVLTV